MLLRTTIHLVEAYLEILLDLCLPLGVHGDLWGYEGGHGHELEVGVADQLPCQPQERLLEVVVTLGTDVVILEMTTALVRDLPY